MNSVGGARKQPPAVVATSRKFQKSLGFFGSLRFSPAYSDGRIRKKNAQVELEVPSVMVALGASLCTGSLVVPAW